MAVEQVKLQQNISTLYQEHHTWIYSWLRKRLSCDYHAEDLAQDTFVRLLARNSEKIKEPRAYLTTVAKGVLSSWYRRKSLEHAYLEALENLPEQQSPSEENRFLILEILHEIDAVLDALSPQVKQTFLLSQLDGLKYQDIAVSQSISLSTVKRYMKQAFLHCLTIDLTEL
ncbi:MAG: RNA polymerase subunit sigma [Gammaproteobacteria bacterium]|nr:MAG: RNA polymerase subunit sigma [Gammaproteobacteria bacterium]